MFADVRGVPATASLRPYLDSIGNYPLLTAEQEVELAERIEAGRAADAILHAGADGHQRGQLEALVSAGQAAHALFVQSNLRLVVSIARRYGVGSAMPLSDLIQEGNLGLIRAVEKFDQRRGFKFSTYATWWIRQAISRAIADKGRTIRVPVHMCDLVSRVARAHASVNKQTGREPTVRELADESGLTERRVRDALSVGPVPVSLATPVGRGDALLQDLVPDAEAISPLEAAVASASNSEYRRMLRRLTRREREVIELRFGFENGISTTLEEIGQRFGCTRERIRQIEAKALSKLRHPSGPPELRQTEAV